MPNFRVSGDHENVAQLRLLCIIGLDLERTCYEENESTLGSRGKFFLFKFFLEKTQFFSRSHKHSTKMLPKSSELFLQTFIKYEFMECFDKKIFKKKL